MNTEDLRIQLSEQIQQLNQYINVAERRLKKSKDLEKRTICTSTRKNGFQYYIMVDGKRSYVKAKDIDAVRKIIQKSYDESVYQKLLTMRYRMERFLKLYDPDAATKVYDDLADARKLLVNPLIMSDEQYIEKWYSNHAGGQNTFPMKGTYLTSKGEEVRSKSEKIIADLLDKYNIPYRYETSLELPDGHYVFPDFVALNVRRRKTVYWEHFGLISDGEYAKKACQKLNLYEENGFAIGEDVIFSMETEDRTLNIKQLELKIEKYLK